MEPIYPQPNSKCLEIFCKCHIFISRNPPYLVHSAARTVMRETTPLYSSIHRTEVTIGQTEMMTGQLIICWMKEVLTGLPPVSQECAVILRWLLPLTKLPKNFRSCSQTSPAHFVQSRSQALPSAASTTNYCISHIYTQLPPHLRPHSRGIAILFLILHQLPETWIAWVTTILDGGIWMTKVICGLCPRINNCIWLCFYNLCLVNSVPAHTDLQPFPGWETPYY